MSFNTVLTREQVAEILADHLRKKIPDLKSVVVGIPAQITVAIHTEEDGKKGT